MLILILMLSCFAVFYIESVGTVIRKTSMDTGNNVIGNALVQALSVVSRLGVFIQSFVFAWIIDEQLFLDLRFKIAALYLAVLSASILGAVMTAPIIVRFVRLQYERKNIKEELKVEVSEVGAVSLYRRPMLYAILGYLFLYLGAIVPLIGQVLMSSFAARSMAIATIINGLSTIILVAILDLKIGYEIEAKKYSEIPGRLMASKLLAALISLVVIVFLAY